jgi:hypothetical protein
MTVFFLPVDAADIWPFLLNTADMADDEKIDHLAQNGRDLTPNQFIFYSRSLDALPGCKLVHCRRIRGWYKPFSLPVTGKNYLMGRTIDLRRSN